MNNLNNEISNTIWVNFRYFAFNQTKKNTYIDLIHRIRIILEQDINNKIIPSIREIQRNLKH